MMQMVYVSFLIEYFLTSSDIYKAKNLLKNFEEMLDNIFRPLFEVSVNPQSHPDLHRFLAQVSSFLSPLLPILIFLSFLFIFSFLLSYFVSFSPSSLPFSVLHSSPSFSFAISDHFQNLRHSSLLGILNTRFRIFLIIFFWTYVAISYI